MGKSGGVFMILGIAFVGLGLSGQRPFLWIGIPFLITGVIGAVLALRQTKPSGSGNTDSREREEAES